MPHICPKHTSHKKRTPHVIVFATLDAQGKKHKNEQNLQNLDAIVKHASKQKKRQEFLNKQAEQSNNQGYIGKTFKKLAKGPRYAFERI